ncbi:IucA/IucC family siderophore biosynthesis protein [Nonomuraea sp. NEAU-A123]|uniref:IucA/IucC family siderophore biosynthesis protein n=1 Tax=Nonomuraea sp. NEAU-A123 TaxID=2839649 RepID=UPI001BE3D6A9|nr:IucA/IucC family siderophore biosynthesis protein [Nonomuraea sp. NEAU-A123]MBT2234534.1 IucA/IucC family siderophore biosynthesis protein [Nonomuraea sp. NEAU-A123]
MSIDLEDPPQGRTEAEFAAELARIRPGLAAAYAEALPGARSTVLGLLWRGLLYEPVPGLAGRESALGRIRLSDGRLLTGPRRLPYDLEVGEDSGVLLDGRAYTRPGELVAALGLPGAVRFGADLERSVASLALARAGAGTGAGAGAGAGPDERSLEWFEQSVVDGHPYHPCCRNRPGVSVAEQLAYMPEHRPVVDLDLIAVPVSRCVVVGVWPDWLRDIDRLLLPAHPWQSRHVLRELGLRPLVAGGIPARPLICVRTLAPVGGGPHLKTAFSTRMTSNVRDISPGSIRDSAPLSAMLVDLARRLDGGLRITRNLAAACAVVNGEPSADLAVLVRESPSEYAGAGETVLPVAALIVRPPNGGPPLIGALPTAGLEWLAEFARLAWGAGLRLLAYGVTLEAHGQNLLVVLDRRGRPLRLVYRDLADIRVSPARLRRNGLTPPPLSPRLITDDPDELHAKLFGSLVGTTFSSLVSALGQGDREVEARLWAAVRAAAVQVFDDLPATADIRADRAALFGAELPVKAHTLMQLDGGPGGDRWARFPNPLSRT